MQKSYYSRHPEIDRVAQRQKALLRYKRLKSFKFKKFELSLEEELFLENFEAAMKYLWGFRGAEIPRSCEVICIPNEWEAPS